MRRASILVFGSLLIAGCTRVSAQKVLSTPARNPEPQANSVLAPFQVASGSKLEYENRSSPSYSLPAGPFAEGKQHGQRNILVEGLVAIRRYQNPKNTGIKELADFYESEFRAAGAEFLLRCTYQTCPGKLYQHNSDLGFPLREGTVYLYAKWDAIPPGRYIGIHITPQSTYVVAVQGRQYGWARDLQKDGYDTVALLCFFGMIAALLFLGVNRQNGRLLIPPIILPVFSFILYFIYEWAFAGKGYKIRIDLFLIYPVLIATAFLAIGQHVRGLKQGELRQNGQDPDILRLPKGSEGYRRVRLVWIVLSNSVAICLVFIFHRQLAPFTHPHMSQKSIFFDNFSTFLRIGILSAGILSEFAKLRVAKYLNIGYYLFFALSWTLFLLTSLWAGSSNIFLTLSLGGGALTAIPCALLAYVNWVFYRGAFPRSSPDAVAVE